MTVYFHTTDAAEKILRDGFRDGDPGAYGIANTVLTGVFIANEPLGWQEGAAGNQLLEVVLPGEHDLDGFELIEDIKTYREWCVPAALLNDHAMIRLLDTAECEALGAWFLDE